MHVPREEISRKLLHLIAILMPAGIYYIPILTGRWYISTIILGVLMIGSIVIEHLRQKHSSVQKIFYKCAGSMLRKEEKNMVTGSTWVISSAFLCSILFKKTPWVSCIVLTLFILGDAVAALVGMSIGRVKIGKKSLEGSCACFLLCMTMFYAVFPFIPGMLSPLGGSVPLFAALVTSIGITVFELIPLRINPSITINDNLAVPVIAGYILKGTIGLFK